MDDRLRDVYRRPQRYRLPYRPVTAARPVMLGVQRPGVTLAVQALEREGRIDARRGKITIIDRRVLEKKSNEAYTRQT